MFRVQVLRGAHCCVRKVDPSAFARSLQNQGGLSRTYVLACVQRCYGHDRRALGQPACRRLYHNYSEGFVGTVHISTNQNTILGNTVVLIGSEVEGKEHLVGSFSRTASGDLFGKELEKCKNYKEILNLVESRKTQLTLQNAVTAIMQLSKMHSKLENARHKVTGRPGFHDICRVIMTAEVDFDTMAKVLKAAALLNLGKNHELSVHLCKLVKKSLDAKELNLSEISLLCPPVSKLQSAESAILKQAVKEIEHRQKSMETADVPNVLRALCVCRDVPKTLLLNITDFIHTNASKLTKSELSRTLHYLTALDYEHIACMFTLSKQCAEFAAEFTDHELSTSLRALIYFRVTHSQLLSNLEEALLGKIPEVVPETLSRVMQYFGSCRFLSPPFFDAVAAHFILNAEKFTSVQLTQLLLPFGKLNYVPVFASEMFDKIEETFNYRWYEFQPVDILDLVHSFVMIERFPLNYTQKVLSPHFLQKFKGPGGVDFQTKCQLTQTVLALYLECPSYKIPKLPWQYQTHFLNRGFDALEVKPKYIYRIQQRVQDLLGGEEFVAFWVPTDSLYHIDIQIKLDKDGFVLPSHQEEGVHTLVALCVTELDRHCVNCHHLTGAEAMRQRHLRLLGYHVIEIPYYELEQLKSTQDWQRYLHRKIFPTSPMLQW